MAKITLRCAQTKKEALCLLCVRKKHLIYLYWKHAHRVTSNVSQWMKMVDIFREKKNLMSSNDGDALSTRVQTQIKFSPFKLPEVLIFFLPMSNKNKLIENSFFLSFLSFSPFLPSNINDAALLMFFIEEKRVKPLSHHCSSIQCWWVVKHYIIYQSEHLILSHVRKLTKWNVEHCFRNHFM